VLRVALLAGTVAVAPPALAVISKVGFATVCVVDSLSWSSLGDSAGVIAAAFVRW
jgi:hypothetical protein